MISSILQRHEIHAISQPVTDIESQVLPHIERMAALCNQRIGIYPGAVALAHCQVERDNPLTFFVFRDGEAVVNPEIVERSDTFIMSLEGCLSIALRPQKNIRRRIGLMVRYTSVNGKKITEITELVREKRACVFQHEMDHSRNKYIY